METVPTLCATGTVGVAALGFAFGNYPHSPRPKSSSHVQRKAPSHTALDAEQTSSMTPSTPSQLPQTASAPTTSRLRKRSSSGRPLSSLSRFGSGKWNNPPTPDSKVHDRLAWASQSLQPDSEQASNQESFAFEFKDNGTAKSSWLRRMSTLSSSRTGSPLSTPRPVSTISISNESTAHGSTAPILSTFTDSSPSTLPRNKLVKRSSSQHALQGNRRLHSTLRRPATSHQRSATLQQQYFPDGGSIYYSPFHSQAHIEDSQEDSNQSSHDSPHTWRPFFKPQAVKLAKEGSSRKRNASGAMNQNEIPRRIIPGISELPTLLLATSISPRSSDDTINDSNHDLSCLDRPTTPVGLGPRMSPSTDQIMSDASVDMESMPRQSFSIAEMFPSRSPSTWKMPRSGSLRRSKGLNGALNGRRVTSAPQSAKFSQSTVFTQGNAGFGTHTTIWSPGRSRNDRYKIGLTPISTLERPSTSPLPPLNRLSSFDIDLPGVAPAYPTSPRPQKSASSPKLSDPISPTMASPSGPITTMNRSQRPSRVPSDRASTLLGSDNDTSRFMSGDEDDMDCRSDTVYDSTRTGATGSSHSGVRRPPIETIFDESPPMEYSKAKSITLQDLQTDDPFVKTNALRNRSAEKLQSLTTPIRVTGPCKDEYCPTPVHIINSGSSSPELSSSPPTLPLKLKSSNTPNPMDDFQDDEIWSFEDAEDKEVNPTEHACGLPKNDHANLFPASPQFDSPLHTLPDSTEVNGHDKFVKPSIFDWSDPAVMDKESVQGSSPRPKTVHGKRGKELRGSRLSGRRGPSALHLRSQSVPVPPDASGHRGHSNTHKLESWILGNKGVSEDWDCDFDFDEPPNTSKHAATNSKAGRNSSGMLVPQAIMERQASVHGQFGQVKELTLLVEELKRLQQQAGVQGIMQGQSVELWKEAEGIVNLATLDDEEQDFFFPRSPSNEFDPFEEDSPSGHERRRSGLSPSMDGPEDDLPRSQTPSRSAPDKSRLETPPMSRPRRESAAKAKSVLETIYQQRNHYNPALLDSKSTQRKLPFDTTSLRDLVTRAGVVTRALKEIVRRAENASLSPQSPPSLPQDPPFSHMFQNPPSSPSVSKIPRVTQSPKSGNFLSGTISGNDNEINGHMKMMTVV